MWGQAVGLGPVFLIAAMNRSIRGPYLKAEGPRSRQNLASVTQRILIVDDERANIELLQAFLEDVADEIRSVTDPRQAEKVFNEFEPDLLLLDLHMPGMDGLTLLRRLSRARDNAGYLPVIVLTADNDKAARDAALKLEADDFLVKPLDRHEVRLRVRNLLQTRHLFKEVTRKTGSFPPIKRSP
jgi:DNA-binding response OmpR family regulator